MKMKINKDKNNKTKNIEKYFDLIEKTLKIYK